MDWSHLSLGTCIALLAVLLAECTNGWTDAPTGTSAAVASGVLTSRQALWVTSIGNFVGLLIAIIVGAAVAKTIGKGIVRPEVISVTSIIFAMLTTSLWAAAALGLRIPVSKTHSLLAALAGIGYAQGGFAALTPASGHWSDSGWVAAGKGVFFALIFGSAISFFLARTILVLKLHTRIPAHWWRRMQLGTVCLVSSGHGFNDGLKYVGIFTLVLFISGVIPEFRVMPWVIVLCAVVMAAGTLLGGRPIHRRLDGSVNGQASANEEKKLFLPYMGVSAELTSGLLIWVTGSFGIPMSTNHGVVAAMSGAKSADGKVHTGSLVRIIWGWVLTYVFCFFGALALTKLFASAGLR